VMPMSEQTRIAMLVFITLISAVVAFDFVL
jgi:hypothetical protein